jgi:hypothetical protein
MTYILYPAYCPIYIPGMTYVPYNLYFPDSYTPNYYPNGPGEYPVIRKPINTTTEPYTTICD